MVVATEHVSGRFYSGVKYHAARRNIEFHLTIDDFESLLIEQNYRCAYTNEILDLKTRNHITGSLDRKDSSLPYVYDNVQFLKKEVNFSKWTMTEEEFMDMISSIYENKFTNLSNI